MLASVHSTTRLLPKFSSFFFTDTATTEIYTLSLHDALPISLSITSCRPRPIVVFSVNCPALRSEEHTSELQSRFDLVCRLLLEKKKRSNLHSKACTLWR